MCTGGTLEGLRVLIGSQAQVRVLGREPTGAANPPPWRAAAYGHGRHLVGRLLCKPTHEAPVRSAPFSPYTHPMPPSHRDWLGGERGPAYVDLPASLQDPRGELRLYKVRLPAPGMAAVVGAGSTVGQGRSAGQIRGGGGVRDRAAAKARAGRPLLVQGAKLRPASRNTSTTRLAAPALALPLLQLVTRTSDLQGAGTDASVWVELHGPDGANSGRIKVTPAPCLSVEATWH